MLLRNLLKVGQPSSADLIWVQRPNNKNQFSLTMDFAVAQMVKNPSAMQETWIWSLGWDDPLEKGMAIHSSILTWRIPWTEEPGGLQSVGSQRVGHDWETNINYGQICLGLIRACGFCLWSPLTSSVAADIVPCLYLKLPHPSISFPPISGAVDPGTGASETCVIKTGGGLERWIHWNGFEGEGWTDGRGGGAQAWWARNDWMKHLDAELNHRQSWRRQWQECSLIIPKYLLIVYTMP